MTFFFSLLSCNIYVISVSNAFERQVNRIKCTELRIDSITKKSKIASSGYWLEIRASVVLSGSP